MAVLLLLFCLAAPSLQDSLVSLKPDTDTGSIKPCKGEDVLSCVVAEVHLDILENESFDLPGCEGLKKKNDIQEPKARAGMKDQAKSIALENELGCEAVFSSRNGKVFGNIELPDGRDFILEPCSAFQGCHVLKEEDSANFKDNEAVQPEFTAKSLFSDRDADALRQQGILDNTTIVTYTTKFYYTLEFKEATDDIYLYFDQLVAEVNQGYINSKIPIRMELYCIEGLNLNDISDGGLMLKTFRDFKGSYDKLRDGADTAALILRKFQYCGIGYLDTWRTGMTVTAQTKGCALGYFTMGHELGHNFGATHDRETGNNKRYSYGYGQHIGPPYLGGDKGFRTIMAYNKEGYGSKANYYSNPDVEFMGYPTGTEETNNARVITENRFGIAAVGNEDGNCIGFDKLEDTELTGPEVRRGLRDNAQKCQNWCNRNEKCYIWTWYSNDTADESLRGFCILRSTFDETRYVPGATAGWV